MTTTVPPAPLPPRPVRPARRLPGPGRPLVADVLAAVAGLGLGITIALGLSTQTLHSVSSVPGFLTAAGRMTGLLAGYAMAVTVALSARIGPLERAIGQDRLIAWHRKLGPWGLYLLLGHVVLITVGYAGLAATGVLAQLWQLILTYQGMLGAAVAVVLLFMAGITSYRRARRRFRYETWWTIHLYTYLALLFAFAHQVDDGASFAGHPLATTWWTAIWVGLLVAVAYWRFTLPIVRSLRHRIRVAEVVRENADVVSIVLQGHRLDRLPVAGGQFFQWRFLSRGAWWEAHPFSLSHVPHRNRMRITVKNLGDHSRDLAGMPVGTPVFIEGPYGRFTADAAGGRGILLVGAGVGITPLVGLLHDLGENADVAMLVRARSRDDLVLTDEISAEIRRRGGRAWEALGSRREVVIDAPTLLRTLPDIGDRDVYVCGPDSFTAQVAAECRAAGVPAARIHFESFVAEGLTMRRAPIVVTATLVGTAGVLLFKPLAPSVVATSASESTGTTPASTGSSDTTSPGTATTTTTSPSATTTTQTGDVETDRYGNTQVRVTIVDGRITEVTVLTYNDGDPRSAEISQAAIPTLRQEVLSRQTAAVDAVSGATYTSNAYEASLQSALDKAGFAAADGSKATTDLATADANLRGH